MAGMGTIINVAAVLTGATAGMLLKGGLPRRFQDILYSSIGLCTLFIGISGAMAIVGSLEDGLNHDYSILFAKSIMDGVLSVVFAASLGIGVYFSAVSLAVYQGSITLLAGVVRPLLSDQVIGKMSFVGSILIFALGINLIFDRKLKIGNMLPAIFMPLVLQFIL